MVVPKGAAFLVCGQMNQTMQQPGRQLMSILRLYRVKDNRSDYSLRLPMRYRRRLEQAFG